MTTNQNDRDDEVLERMTAGLEPATADEAAARVPYQQLMKEMQAVDPLEPAAGWEQRVDARLREERDRERRRRRVWVGAGVAMAAAAAMVLLLWPRPASVAHAFTSDVLAQHGGARRGDSAVVGDTLRLRATSPRPHHELRVYRGEKLVGRCPVDAACRVDGAVLRLDLVLREEGAYRAYFFTSEIAIPPPRGDRGGDLADAKLANVRVDDLDELRVMP